MSRDAASWDRWVAMEGCANFRDAGGYPTKDGRTVRRGLLYRSGSPARMSARDVALVCGELKIRTVVDLRGEDEARQGGPAPFADDHGVRMVSIPMGDGPTGGTQGLPDLTDGLGPLYIFSAQQGRYRLAEAVEVVARHCGEPLVVHCAGGKDRTGVVIALILDVLGVPHDLIVEDYALTERHLERIPREHLAALARQMGEHGWPEAILHAVPGSMSAFLEWLADEHGSAAEFLAGQPGGSDTVTSLRRGLLQ